MIKKICQQCGKEFEQNLSRHYHQKRFCINCRGKWLLKYPAWTNDDDVFAVNFLGSNPDLRCLAREFAKQWGFIYSERIYHRVRCRSSMEWKLGLKKERVRKGLNNTIFSPGLQPWNKGQTKNTNPSLATMSKKISVWSRDFWINGPLESVERMRDAAIRNIMAAGEKTRFLKGHKASPEIQERRIVEYMRTRNQLGRTYSDDKYIKAKRLYRKIILFRRHLNV